MNWWPNRSLVIYCRAFKVRTLTIPNLTLKKIPKGRSHKKCEWGHDDYSLEITNLPTAEPPPVPQEGVQQATTSRRSRKRLPSNRHSLPWKEVRNEHSST